VPKVLAGLRVVEMGTFITGPAAAMYLGDLGADVIKVERPGTGDPFRSFKGGLYSPHYQTYNRNKRAITLDTSKEEDRKTFHELIETADVFIQNFRPGVAEKLGAGEAELKALNPRLVYCAISGWGTSGPYRDRPAYDSIIQGMAGVAACNQRVMGEPRFVPMVFADHVVGLIAAQCILAALYHRERTGEGQAIEVPMFENMAAFVLAQHLGDRTFVPPLGESGDRRVLHPLAKPNQTKDGWICVSANTDAQAFALFEAIGRPELKSDPRFCSVKARYDNVREYFQVRADGLRQRTTVQWLEILEKADVPAGPVHSFESLTEDEHLAQIGFFRKVEHPIEGEMIDMRHPNKFSAGLREDYGAAPLLGGHSVEILSELGYAESEIDDMVRSSAIIDGRAACGQL
jgi:crotonobetainyl-CoA:carnitine CoA-transferase CaiB-like acyl-CoA transferase